MAVTFFKSVKNPGLSMNRFGVVFAERSHELADNELWGGVTWTSVPLKRGNLDVKDSVEDEAYNSGYRYEYVRHERVWKKPGKAKKEQVVS